MATAKRIPLTRAEHKLWRQAFLAAQVSVLIKGRGTRLNPAGVAHLAAEYAHAAVLEDRRARSGAV